MYVYIFPPYMYTARKSYIRYRQIPRATFIYPQQHVVCVQSGQSQYFSQFQTLFKLNPMSDITLVWMCCVNMAKRIRLRVKSFERESSNSFKFATGLSHIDYSSRQSVHMIKALSVHSMCRSGEQRCFVPNPLGVSNERRKLYFAFLYKFFRLKSIEK